MNTSLTVKLIADANFIPVMYRVVEMTVGSTAAATYCVLQVVRVGWDTEPHYSAWKATVSQVESNMLISGRAVTGMVGAMNALSVAALSAITAYNTPAPSTDM